MENDQNNNAAPDLQIVAEKGPAFTVDYHSWDEVIMIQSIFPNCSIKVIKEYLSKYSASPNRVQIVTHRLLELTAETADEGAVSCPIPAKKAKPPSQPEPESMFFGPTSHNVPFPFENSPNSTRTGAPTCTIVRPEQETYESRINAPSTSALQPHEQPIVVDGATAVLDPSVSKATVANDDLERQNHEPVTRLAPEPSVLASNHAAKDDATAGVVMLPSTGAIKKTAIPQKPKTKKPPHIFVGQLRELFPDIKVSFLEEVCRDRPDYYPIQNVIEELLNRPDLPMKVKVKEEPKVEETTDTEAAYQAFKEILPDADPEYLEFEYQRVHSDPEKLKLFIANALEKRDYPKLEAYQQRQAQFALEKCFKDNFDVVKFLELFPDPVKHFSNPELEFPTGRSPGVGRAFLMARYRRLRCTTIDRVYKRHHFMLYTTCKDLDRQPDEMRPRQNHDIVTTYKSENSLSFLQEIGFIENEAKILALIQGKKDEEKKIIKDREKAFKKAKLAGELLTCGCCFDDEVLSIDMVPCEEGHLFCKECVKKGAEVQIGNGRTDFPCLEGCNANIRLETLEGVLLPAVFLRLVQRKQIEEVKAAGIESFETCPFCEFGLIPHPDDRVFACQNPECLKESCRLCKEPSHIPLRCDEVEKSDEVKARTYIEDKMTEALVRTCWSCQKKFVKSDGCNKMTCSCGALMCYLCRQPVKDYSHFNGQGGDAFEKCPLYSNNNVLHVDAVEEVGRKAKEELQAKNPALTLKHDPTIILPAKDPEQGPGRHQAFGIAAAGNIPGLHRGWDPAALGVWPPINNLLRDAQLQLRNAQGMLQQLAGPANAVAMPPGGEPAAARPLPAAARPLPAAARPLPAAARLLPAAARPLPGARLVVHRPLAAARPIGVRPLPAAGGPVAGRALPAAGRQLPDARPVAVRPAGPVARRPAGPVARRPADQR